jgi:flagellar assembly protein FliH
MRSLATAASVAPRCGEAAPGKAPPAAVQLDQAELHKLRQEAREGAAAVGLHEGRAEGHAQGLAEGKAQGYAAGLAAGKAAAEAQAGQLRTLTAALPEALRRAQEEIAEALVALALDLARQVVHRSLLSEPHWIVPVVHDLLQKEPALQGEPRLLLHPEDVELVTGALGNELQSAGWQVRADPGISRGGCRVQAATGAQDATVETRWARVSAALGVGRQCTS